MRLVFCTTTGRSGSKWLAYVLSKQLKAIVEHEGEPKMVELRKGGQPSSFNQIKKWWNDKKLPYIKKISGELPYIDTGHLINKGFLEPLMDLDIVPDLIVLRRDPRAVAKSLLKLKTVPFRTEKGKKYCISEYDKVYLQLPMHQEWSDYQLCYWYCLECQVRATLNKRNIVEAGGKVCEVEFQDILKESYVASRISDSFGISKKSRLERLGRFIKYAWTSEKEKNINKKEAQKLNNNDYEIDYDQEEIEVIISINKVNKCS